MFHAFVLVRLPVGSRKRVLKSCLKVSATLGLFLDPGSPPKGGPETSKRQVRERNMCFPHRRRAYFTKTKKCQTHILRMCAHFSSARLVLAITGRQINANQDGVLNFSSWPFKLPEGARQGSKIRYRCLWEKLTSTVSHTAQARNLFLRAARGKSKRLSSASGFLERSGKVGKLGRHGRSPDRRVGYVKSHICF